MPTFEWFRRFGDDLAGLTPAQRLAFKEAVEHFVADLRRGSFRKGLRVKGIKGTSGVFEMTWAPDGRATFEYGEPVIEGTPHIVWRRIGTHEILGAP